MSSTGVGANRKEWIIRGGNGSNKTLIDRLLEVRGISSEEAKKDFLNPLSITQKALGCISVILRGLRKIFLTL